MGVPWRTGRHDGHGHPSHGSIICSWIACSALLLNRRRHGFTFLIDVWHAGGRRCSNRRCYALFNRSADRRNLWRSRGDVSCSSRGHSEKPHNRSSFVCRDPESADPGDDTHPIEDEGTCDFAMVRWVLRHAPDFEHRSWCHRGLRSTINTTDDPKEDPMKVLTVFANPNPKSFCHAILEAVHQGT